MLSLKKRRYLFLQCSLLVLFLLGSALLTACSSGPNSGTATLAPTPTLSLQMGIGDLSPTPTPFAYSCGAWATQTTPSYGVDRIGINAKFTKLVNGNPQGVDGATAKATVHWPNNTTDELSVQTTFDGLAVFTVQAAGHSDAINKITLVTVEFTKSGVPPCEVGTNQAAFFTLVMTAKPTPTATPDDNNHHDHNGDNNNNDNNNNNN